MLAFMCAVHVASYRPFSRRRLPFQLDIGAPIDYHLARCRRLLID